MFKLSCALLRWILQRITRDPQRDAAGQPTNRTVLNLEGHASCIAEGLAVPWLFSMLDAAKVDYWLNVELSGRAPWLR